MERASQASTATARQLELEELSNSSWNSIRGQKRRSLLAVVATHWVQICAHRSFQQCNRDCQLNEVQSFQAVKNSNFQILLFDSTIGCSRLPRLRSGRSDLYTTSWQRKLSQYLITHGRSCSSLRQVDPLSVTCLFSRLEATSLFLMIEHQKVQIKVQAFHFLSNPCSARKIGSAPPDDDPYQLLDIASPHPSLTELTRRGGDRKLRFRLPVLRTHSMFDSTGLTGLIFSNVKPV